VILGAKPIVALVEISKPVGAVTTIAPRGPVALIDRACAVDAFPTVVVKLAKFDGVVAIWAFESWEAAQSTKAKADSFVAVGFMDFIMVGGWENVLE